MLIAELRMARVLVVLCWKGEYQRCQLETPEKAVFVSLRFVWLARRGRHCQSVARDRSIEVELLESRDHRKSAYFISTFAYNQCCVIYQDRLK